MVLKNETMFMIKNEVKGHGQRKKKEWNESEIRPVNELFYAESKVGN